VGRVYRALWSRRSAIVYEVLDIHRSMVGAGLASRALRAAERALARASTGVITSSPGFVKAYFEAINPLGRPLTIVENKVFYPDGPPPTTVSPRTVGGGWVVGWFGGLRCGRSFEVLTQAAARMGGALRLVLAGRAAATEIPDFDARAAAAPCLDWRGPYRNPEDLPRLYGDVHFVWTIDFHEAETNSKWLLPNRLYEGGLFGAVPIARSGTETAEWMRERGIGLVLDEVDSAGVERLLRAVTQELYRDLQRAVAALPRSTWVTTDGDCAALVDVILGPREGSGRPMPAATRESAA
jgi:succinoglycan biosynthesis protein ExoL